MMRMAVPVSLMMIMAVRVTMVVAMRMAAATTGRQRRMAVVVQMFFLGQFAVLAAVAFEHRALLLFARRTGVE